MKSGPERSSPDISGKPWRSCAHFALFENWRGRQAENLRKRWKDGARFRRDFTASHLLPGIALSRLILRVGLGDLRALRNEALMIIERP